MLFCSQGMEGYKSTIDGEQDQFSPHPQPAIAGLEQYGEEIIKDLVEISHVEEGENHDGVVVGSHSIAAYQPPTMTSLQPPSFQSGLPSFNSFLAYDHHLVPDSHQSVNKMVIDSGFNHCCEDEDKSYIEIMPSCSNGASQADKMIYSPPAFNTYHELSQPMSAIYHPSMTPLTTGDDSKLIAKGLADCYAKGGYQTSVIIRNEGGRSDEEASGSAPADIKFKWPRSTFRESSRSAFLHDNGERKHGNRLSAESRYRHSINTKIGKLKEIIAGPEATLKKSEVLAATIDFIDDMQRSICKMEEENSMMKTFVMQNKCTMGEKRQIISHNAILYF